MAERNNSSPAETKHPENHRLLHPRTHLCSFDPDCQEAICIASGSACFLSSKFLNQPPFTMAAAIKAINAKIRSNKVLDYVCSTRTFLSSFSSIASLGVLFLDDGVLVAPDLPHPQSYVSAMGQMLTRGYRYRFLGPRIQLRYSGRCGYGHSERS